MMLRKVISRFFRTLKPDQPVSVHLRFLGVSFQPGTGHSENIAMQIPGLPHFPDQQSCAAGLLETVDVTRSIGIDTHQQWNDIRVMFFKPQELFLGAHFERTLDVACCTMLIFISNLLPKAMDNSTAPFKSKHLQHLSPETLLR
jgi:hypothetical protein